jgi:hypothetical protein
VKFDISGAPKATKVTGPTTAKAGVTRVEVSSSAKGEHGVQLVRVDKGHSVAEALKAGGGWGDKGKPLPSWVHLEGGTGSAKTGGSAAGTVVLQPGQYVAADISSDKPGFAEFKVTGEASGSLPSADGGSISAKEYSFKTSGLKAGKNTVEFDNTGKQPHFVAAVGIVEGATLADVKKFFKTEKGKPPIDESRHFDTAVVDGGGKQSVDLDIKPGKYALICFVPDRKGGPPHAEKGMISEAVIK